jgi:integrase
VTALVRTAAAPAVPALVSAAGPRTAEAFLEFLTAEIRNPHTRRAYARAAADFLAWCADAGVGSVAEVRPLHVAAWAELQARERALLDGIDASTPAGLRDRALLALMVYTFARVGAALGMRVGDVEVRGRRLWVSLREKGGKAHAVPCHHALEEALVAYLEGTGIGADPRGPLFRTIGRGTGLLTRTPLAQANAHAMIRRRAAAAGIRTRIGCHSLRATGITAYLKAGGTLETAAAIANHASTRTTQLYDRRGEELSLAEVERIRL